jgi:hypothetical protein
MIIENVDLTLSSDLNFSKFLDKKKDHVFWRLELGLGLDFLYIPMCETILKGLLHFFAFIAENFDNSTMAISIYRGQYAHFLKNIHLIEKIFRSLPDAYPVVIEITDAHLVLEQIIELHLLKAQLHPIKLAFFDSKIEADFYLNPPLKKCNTAFLIQEDATKEIIAATIKHIEDKKLRLIPEKLFAMEWDELDRIYTNQELLSEETKRLLLGFSVTGVEILGLYNK